MSKRITKKQAYAQMDRTITMLMRVMLIDHKGAHHITTGLENHFNGRKSVNREAFQQWFDEACDIAKHLND